MIIFTAQAKVAAREAIRDMPGYPYCTPDEIASAAIDAALPHLLDATADTADRSLFAIRKYTPRWLRAQAAILRGEKEDE